MEVANLVVAVIAALAAIVAAIFAFKAPSKDDLKRVENQLATQNRREEILVESQRVSITVNGEGLDREDITLEFCVGNRNVVMQTVELVNRKDLRSGSASCVDRGTGRFAATFKPAEISGWMLNSDDLESRSFGTVNIRALFHVEGHAAERTFAVNIRKEQRIGNSAVSYYYTVSGNC
jgi:hypothetical protein